MVSFHQENKLTILKNLDEHRSGMFWLEDQEAITARTMRMKLKLKQKLKIVDISECNTGISSHIEIYISETGQDKQDTLERLKNCPDYNEITLIKNRALIENPATTKICSKHRSELGKLQQEVSIMQVSYVHHKRSHHSKTPASSFRSIPLNVLREIKVVKQGTDVCMGSVWCSSCRLRKYENWRNDSLVILQEHQGTCQFCGEDHNAEDSDAPFQMDYSSQDTRELSR